MVAKLQKHVHVKEKRLEKVCITGYRFTIAQKIVTVWKEEIFQTKGASNKRKDSTMATHFPFFARYRSRLIRLIHMVNSIQTTGHRLRANHPVHLDYQVNVAVPIWCHSPESKKLSQIKINKKRCKAYLIAHVEHAFLYFSINLLGRIDECFLDVGSRFCRSLHEY